MTNAIFSPAEFPWARAYFAQLPTEPGGAGQVNIPVQPQESNFERVSLGDLHMLASGIHGLPIGSSLVLYTHGDADRDIGVSMWLDHSYQLLMTLDVVKSLCDSTPKEFARQFKVPEVMVGVWRQMIIDIQVCQLNHVAFRACNIGKRPDYLLAFARLFNIRTVSAPKMRDFFSFDNVRRLNEDEMTLADHGATPQLLARFTKTSRQNKAKKSDAKYRTIRMGDDVVKLLVVPVSYAFFQTEIFASSAKAVERFYREYFCFRNPLRFTESDFRGTNLMNEGVLNPFAKSVPLFGLSEYGSTDRVLFPNEASYLSQIEVVHNDQFVGGVPFYNAPPPDPDEKIGTLRDRLRFKVKNALGKI